jgi:hypothetical protein
LAGCASRHEIDIELTTVCSGVTVHYTYEPPAAEGKGEKE